MCIRDRTYTIENNENEVHIGDKVLIVNPQDAASGSANLQFVAPQETQFAGDYTGTVIFTASVEPAERVEGELSLIHI